MVLVIGGGLAGSLAALVLRERGLPVTLLSQEPAPATASQCSYGGVPWWAAPALARAPELWQALERRHGPLGWQPCTLTLHGGCANPSAIATADPQALAAAAAGLKALLAAAGETVLELLGDQGQLLGLELPYGRVDSAILAAALPAALRKRVSTLEATLLAADEGAR
jgi:glycine/D-amino acid oxidase-like deaminating enzyme